MLFYLIDDDSATLNILRMIIEDSDSGSVIGSAASGLDALEDLRYMRPDIVLVDLLMPGMDGIEFVRQARSRYPDLRFVMPCSIALASAAIPPAGTSLRSSGISSPPRGSRNS